MHYCTFIWKLFYLFTMTLLYLDCTMGQTNMPKIFRNNDQMILKTCKSDNIFRRFTSMSLMDCAYECELRSRCQFMMFHTTMNLCSLIGDISEDEKTNFIDDLPDSQPLCVYVNVKEQSNRCEPEEKTACSSHKCDLTQRCTVINKEAECKTTECLHPPPINNAFLLSDTCAVGTNNVYKCKDNTGLEPHGNPRITCNENGTWSFSDFTCRKPVVCFDPGTMDNAERIDEEESPLVQGSVLKYSCKSRYAMAEDDTFSIECGSSGDWNATFIPCCHEGYIFYYKNLCYKEFPGYEGQTWEVMNKECKDYGNVFGGYYNSSEGRLNMIWHLTNQAMLMIVNKKDKILDGITRQLLTECNRDGGGANCVTIVDLWDNGQLESDKIGKECVAVRTSDAKLVSVSCDSELGFQCFQVLPRIVPTD